MNDGIVERRSIELIDAELLLFERVFSEAKALRFYDALCADVNWRQDVIKIIGKEIPLPRLQAWYADTGLSYTYSGLKMPPSAWSKELGLIRDRVEQISGYEFNSVLLSRYRNGSDSMGWHSDDESELGRNPVIASYSLGATRRFLLRHKRKTEQRLELELTNNSLLLMSGPIQHHWRHAIPKTKKLVGERINLTFRRILPAD